MSLWQLYDETPGAWGNFKTGDYGTSIEWESKMDDLSRQRQNQANWSRALSGSGSSGSDVEPKYKTVSSPKNTRINDLLDSGLNDISGLSTDATKKQGTLQTYTKNTDLQGSIDRQRKQNDVDTGNINQSVSDFVSAWMGQQGGAEGRANEEAGSLDEIYNGGLENKLGQTRSDLEGKLSGTRSSLASSLSANRNALEANLAKVRGQEKYANIANLQRRLAALGAQRNLGALSGLSDSYLNAQLADAVANASIQNDLNLAGQLRSDTLGLSQLDRNDIGTLSGLERSDISNLSNLSRQDIASLLQAKMAAGGKRNALIDAVLTRRLTAPEVINQYGNAATGRLAALSNLDQSNNIYQLQTPQELIAQKLAALGSATNLSNANNFYGLSGEYIPDQRGYLPINMPSSPRTYNFRNYGGGGGGGRLSYSRAGSGGGTPQNLGSRTSARLGALRSLGLSDQDIRGLSPDEQESLLAWDGQGQGDLASGFYNAWGSMTGDQMAEMTPEQFDEMAAGYNY